MTLEASMLCVKRRIVVPVRQESDRFHKVLHLSVILPSKVSFEGKLVRFRIFFEDILRTLYYYYLDIYLLLANYTII